MRAIIFLLIVCLATNAFAQESNSTASSAKPAASSPEKQDKAELDQHYDPNKQFERIIKKRQGLRAGLGLFVADLPYKDTDPFIFPFPFVHWRFKKFFFTGLSCGYIPYVSKSLKISLSINPRIIGYRASDSDTFSGMDDRDFSLDGSMGLSWQPQAIKGVSLSLGGSTDLLFINKGKTASFHLGKTLKVKLLWVTLSGGISWQNQRMLNYYYGVRESEARSDRMAYTPKAETNYNTALTFMLPITKNWAVFNSFSAQFYGSQIRNSPLVDKDYMLATALGVNFQF